MKPRIIVGDCIEQMNALSERSVHCCVTSPPYWGLRDYKHDGAYGLEKTLDEYVAKMVDTFQAVKRVLRDDGTLWLNLGDAYCTTTKGSDGGSPKQDRNIGSKYDCRRWNIPSGLKPKDLCGIPWRVAFALQADGWYLRDAIIWHKPAPMPGSQRDRCTSSYEFIFQLTKRPRYYFDMEAVKEPCAEQVVKEPDGWDVGDGSHGTIHREGRSKGRPNAATISTRVPRNVWKMANEGFKGAHFATFPRELPTRCIKASTSERDCCPSCGAGWVRLVERDRKPTRPGKNNASDDTGMANRDEQRHVTETRTTGWERGCDCSDNGSPPVPCRVLDPFHGAGTTAIAACLLGCEYVGIELNPDYAQMSRERIDRELNPSTARTDTEEPSPLFAG